MLAVGALSDILKQKVWALSGVRLILPPCSRPRAVGHTGLLSPTGRSSDAVQHRLHPCACSTMQDSYKKSLEGMLMTHVLPLFQSSHGHLRAKAAWVSPCRSLSSLTSGASWYAVIHTVLSVTSILLPNVVHHLLASFAGGRHICRHQICAWRLWRRAELCSALPLRCGSPERHRAAGELMRQLCTELCRRLQGACKAEAYLHTILRGLDLIENL